LPSELALTNLVGKVYDAATDAALWEPFLGELAAAFRAEASALVMHHRTTEVHTVSASWNLVPDADRLYQQHYGSVDVWAMRGRSMPAGYVCASESLCSYAELATTEIYNDFLLRYRIVHGMFGLVENDGSRWASVSLYRGQGSNEFCDSDLEALNFLAPHVQRAFRLHFQFSKLKARSEGVEAALDMLSSGIIILGAKGEILLMNRWADDLLKHRDGLLASTGRLSATVRSESTRLQGMIHGAARTGSGKGLSSGGTMLISREKGRPLAVTVAPLREFNPFGSQQPAAALFVSDPDRCVELPEDLLRRCYGLTLAEARLTMALLEGKSLKEAADVCGVTHNTAKSELKVIFLKTQVNRQGELIRLLLNTAGMTERK